MTEKPVSLVIVNYNGFRATKNCLESVFSARGLKPEVIVVDNASTDSSGDQLEKLRDKQNFILIHEPTNRFLAAAYNRGFQESHGEIVVFMNNDLIVTDHWLEDLSRVFDQPQAGIGGVCLYYLPQHKGVDSLGYQLNILGYGIRNQAPTPGQSFREVFYVSGALLAIKRGLFEKLGGFDDSYGAYYEDVDLAWRTKLLGFKAIVAKNATVYHHRSWTINKFLKQAATAYLCRRNRLTTLLKNAGSIYLALTLPLYLALQIIIFFKEVFVDRDLNLALTTPRAIGNNLINLKTTLQKRKAIQHQRRVSDWQILRYLKWKLW